MTSGAVAESNSSATKTASGSIRARLEGLVPSLGLKAVNGQVDIIDSFVLTAMASVLPHGSIV